MGATGVSLHHGTGKRGCSDLGSLIRRCKSSLLPSNRFGTGAVQYSLQARHVLKVVGQMPVFAVFYKLAMEAKGGAIEQLSAGALQVTFHRCAQAEKNMWQHFGSSQ